VDTLDREITSDSSGFFKLEAFPDDEVKLSTADPEYFKITGLKIHQHEYQQFALMIDHGPYYFAGWVDDQNGVSLEGARVSLIANFKDNHYHSCSHSPKLSDNNGEFEFQQVGGGIHTLSIFSAGYQNMLYSMNFLTMPTA
jgi:hypothetical protein